MNLPSLISQNKIDSLMDYVKPPNPIHKKMLNTCTLLSFEKGPEIIGFKDGHEYSIFFKKGEQTVEKALINPTLSSGIACMFFDFSNDNKNLEVIQKKLYKLNQLERLVVLDSEQIDLDWVIANEKVVYLNIDSASESDVQIATNFLNKMVGEIDRIYLQGHCDAKPLSVIFDCLACDSDEKDLKKLAYRIKAIMCTSTNNQKLLQRKNEVVREINQSYEVCIGVEKVETGNTYYNLEEDRLKYLNFNKNKSYYILSPENHPELKHEILENRIKDGAVIFIDGSCSGHYLNHLKKTLTNLNRVNDLVVVNGNCSESSDFDFDFDGVFQGEKIVYVEMAANDSNEWFVNFEFHLAEYVFGLNDPSKLNVTGSVFINVEHKSTMHFDRIFRTIECDLKSMNVFIFDEKLDSNSKSVLKGTNQKIFYKMPNMNELAYKWLSVDLWQSFQLDNYDVLYLDQLNGENSGNLLRSWVRQNHFLGIHGSVKRDGAAQSEFVQLDCLLDLEPSESGYLIRENGVKNIGFEAIGYQSIEKQFINPWLDSGTPLIVIERNADSSLLNLITKRLHQVGNINQLVALKEADFDFKEIIGSNKIVHFNVMNDKDLEQLKSLLIKLETVMDDYFYEAENVHLPYGLIFNGFGDSELDLGPLHGLVARTGGKKLITPNKANLMPLKRNDHICIGFGQDNELKYLKMDSNNSNRIVCNGLFTGDVIASRVRDGGVIFIDVEETAYLDEIKACLSSLDRLDDLVILKSDSYFNVSDLVLDEKIVYVCLKKEELADWLRKFKYSFNHFMGGIERERIPTITSSLFLNSSNVKDVLSESGLCAIYNVINTTAHCVNLFVFSDSYDPSDYVDGECKRKIFYGLTDDLSHPKYHFEESIITNSRKYGWCTVYKEYVNGIWTDLLINDFHNKMKDLEWSESSLMDSDNT